MFPLTSIGTIPPGTNMFVIMPAGGATEATGATGAAGASMVVATRVVGATGAVARASMVDVVAFSMVLCARAIIF